MWAERGIMQKTVLFIREYCSKKSEVSTCNEVSIFIMFSYKDRLWKNVVSKKAGNIHSLTFYSRQPVLKLEVGGVHNPRYWWGPLQNHHNWLETTFQVLFLIMFYIAPFSNTKKKWGWTYRYLDALLSFWSRLLISTSRYYHLVLFSTVTRSMNCMQTHIC